MSRCSRAVCFVLSGLIFFVIRATTAGCAGSRPAGAEASLSEVNKEVTSEDILMYTAQPQSPRIVSSITLSPDSIYYANGEPADWSSDRTNERPLQQQPLSDVDLLQIEHGGLRGGAIGFAMGITPGAIMVAEAQSQERSCESIGCGIGAGLSQAGGAVLMLLGGLTGTLLRRTAGKKTETVYRAPEFRSRTSMPDASREAPI